MWIGNTDQGVTRHLKQFRVYEYETLFLVSRLKTVVKFPLPIRRNCRRDITTLSGMTSHEKHYSNTYINAAEAPMFVSNRYLALLYAVVCLTEVAPTFVSDATLIALCYLQT